MYLDLITSLSEEELVILFHHKSFNKNYDNEREELDKLKERMLILKENMKKETIIIEKSKYQDDYDMVSSNIKKIQNKHRELEKYRGSEFYKISEQKFVFFKQRLFSKGLILDWGIGRIGVSSFQMMSITEFGNEFLEFIKGNENSCC